MINSSNEKTMYYTTYTNHVTLNNNRLRVFSIYRYTLVFYAFKWVTDVSRRRRVSVGSCPRQFNADYGWGWCGVREMFATLGTMGTTLSKYNTRTFNNIMVCALIRPNDNKCRIFVGWLVGGWVKRITAEP